MANETILVVDADQKSQKVLEVSFNKAGYRVIMANSLADARDAVQTQQPDLVISETTLPDGDGFAFCEELHAQPQRPSIPFVFLTDQRALPDKMRGLERGADEYLTKPIYIKEVTSRIDVLLQKRAQQRLSGGDDEHFEATLADVTMIDLLQTLERQRRSGSIEIRRDGRRGAVQFRDGNILDARCEKLQGEEALYRLMLWPDGRVRVQYHDSKQRTDHIDKDSEELLLEGIRRLGQWNDLVDTLPSLRRVYAADYQRLSDALDELPQQAGRLVRLFDGVRSLRDVVDDSPFGDINTLQIIRRLLDEQLLSEMAPTDTAPSDGPSNLETWLADADVGDDIPTPFRQVDSSVDVVAPDVSTTDPSLAAKPAAKGPDSGQWKVHWQDDDHDDSADATDMEDLEEREERRREEEARHLLRQSGRFETSLPQTPSADRNAKHDGTRRQTTPIEHADRGARDPSANTDRQRRGRTRTPVSTPAGPNADSGRSAADSTSPGIQVARLFDDPEPAATDRAGVDTDDVDLADADVNDDQPADDPTDDDDDLSTSAERRAASVEEAASVKREAARSVRDSAPFAAVDPDDSSDEQHGPVDEDERDGPVDEQDGPVDEQHGPVDEQTTSQPELPEEPVDRAHRVTEEISSVERDEQEQGAPLEDIERTAANGKIVHAEYDLASSAADSEPSQSSAPTETNPANEAADPDDLEAPLPEEHQREADAAESFDETAADSVVEAADSEDARLDDDSDQAADSDQADATNQIDDAAHAEPAGAEVDLNSSDSPHVDEDARTGGADDAFVAAGGDQDEHADSFFAEGRNGDYDWDFEDVPETSNRWKYFTALVVVVAATAIVIGVSTSDSSTDQDTAGNQVAGDGQTPANSEPVGSGESAEADKAADSEDKVAAPQAVGLSAAIAPQRANDHAAEVRQRTRHIAMVLGGAAPALTGQPSADAAAAENGQPSGLSAAQTPRDSPQAAAPGPSESSPPTAADSFEARLDEAKVRLRQGQNSQALEMLRTLSDRKPKHRQTAYLHGKAALAAGRNSEAIKQLERAEKFGYHRASLYLDLGTAHQLTGHSARAREAYRQFLKVQPSGKRAEEVRSILEQQL